MKFYFTKTPLIFMRIFSKYKWRFITDKKEIFLTFDDGPTPKITSFVLNQLERYNAKATFFCLIFFLYFPWNAYCRIANYFKKWNEMKKK